MTRGSAPLGARRSVLLTVSGVVPADVAEQVKADRRPRPDYLELARAMDADVMDLAEARRRTGRLGRLLERIGGPGALVAWASFRQRGRYDAVVTDGEQVGMVLALLCVLTRQRIGTHMMIVHLLSTRRKSSLFKLFRLGRHVDVMLVYSSWQQRFVVEELGIPAHRVVLTPFMVDTRFFAPRTGSPRARPMICTAGLEQRDYPTLMEAVRGLELDVVIAAASPWSKRADTTQGVPLPSNVTVCQLGYADLRDLYADSLFVVVPLFDVGFQAGVTTILEAMGMSKAVICSRTVGQTDVVTDGVTGIYVDPADAAALRSAIIDLVGDPERARHIGDGGRQFVLRECDVQVYAQRLAGLLEAAREQGRQGRCTTDA